MKRKGWQVLPLGEVCQVNPKIGVDAPAPDKPVSFVPMAAVDEQRGAIAQKEERAYREVAKGYTYFRDNDVLFAKITPCMENGKAAIARGLTNGIGFGSTEFHVLRPSAAVLPEWVFAFIRQPSFRAVAKMNFTGTAGQQRVPTEFMKTVEIPIPPLDEQRRIVAILDEAEALRQLRARADARMAEFIPALFNQMFGDPATNPKGWKVVPAGDLMILCEYGTSQKASDDGVGIPVLRMSNVTVDGSLDLTDLKAVDLNESERAKYLLNEGDVLFNRTNSRELVGKTGMWDGRFEAVAASYFIRVRFDPEREHPQHFTTFMNLPYMKRQLAQTARGAVGQANINAQELRAIEVPLPPLTLQREFAARVAEAQAMQDQQTQSRVTLEAGFQAVLHKAFSGEL
jgi:type I restriction enzyme S subunit